MNTSAWFVFAEDTSTECMIGPALLLWSVADWTTHFFLLLLPPLVYCEVTESWQASHAASNGPQRQDTTDPTVDIPHCHFIRMCECWTTGWWIWQLRYLRLRTWIWWRWVSLFPTLCWTSTAFIWSGMNSIVALKSMTKIRVDYLWPVSYRRSFKSRQTLKFCCEIIMIDWSSSWLVHYFYFVFVWMSLDFVLDSRWLQVNRFNG